MVSETVTGRPAAGGAGQAAFASAACADAGMQKNRPKREREREREREAAAYCFAPFFTIRSNSNYRISGRSRRWTHSWIISKSPVTWPQTWFRPAHDDHAAAPSLRLTTVFRNRSRLRNASPSGVRNLSAVTTAQCRACRPGSRAAPESRDPALFHF